MSRFLLLCSLLAIVVGTALYLVPQKRTEEVKQPLYKTETIGVSVEKREIIAHHFGNGTKHLVVVGGIHGGYEWNTSLLAEELISYFTKSPDAIPKNTRLTIIPVANPDGLKSVAGTTTNLASVTFDTSLEKRKPGRSNARGIDLNRNFDCLWAPTSTWGTQIVKAGEAPFSEPESDALRSFVHTYNPDAFIFLHSKANGVFGSACENGVLQSTMRILNAYASSSGYKAVELFDAYPITGDAEGWLASINIPAITVELATHEETEFEKNLNGVAAVMEGMLGW